MSAPLVTKRPEPSEQPLKTGAPVSTTTWAQLATLANWSRAKGACLVPWTMPLRTIGPGNNDTFRFRVKTRSSAVQRVWQVTMAAQKSTPAGVTIKAPGATGAAYDLFVAKSDDGATKTTVTYVETLAAQTATEQEITINVAVTGDELMVEAICCYEQDRPSLDLASPDVGIFVPTVGTDQPIYDQTFRSVGGVMDTLAALDARRVGIYHWTQGDSVAALTSSATPAPLTNAVPVLTRKDIRTSTTGNLKWSVYAKVTGGTGTVTLTTTSGVNDSHSVTSGSFAWTAARTVAPACEDMSAVDGRRGGAWDYATINISCSGGFSLTVQSISIWED
jgi:hypothetical protein